MWLLTKLISAFIVVYGCMITFNPALLPKVIEYFKGGEKMYIGSGIKALFGLIFLMAASECSIPGIIRIFGILMLLGGVSAFALKKERIFKLFDWWLAKPAKTLRLVGITTIVVGIVMIISV